MPAGFDRALGRRASGESSSANSETAPEILNFVAGAITDLWLETSHPPSRNGVMRHSLPITESQISFNQRLRNRIAVFAVQDR
jgi:hypothetical protein